MAVPRPSEREPVANALKTYGKTVPDLCMNTFLAGSHKTEYRESCLKTLKRLEIKSLDFLI